MKNAMDLTAQVLRENWLLLAVPVCAACVGHTLGRLLRGRVRK